MEKDLTVNTEQINPTTTVIHVAGDVTMFAEAALKKAYRTACKNSCSNIIINFQENGYINSAGIAVLISIVGEVKKRKQRLLLAIPSTHFQKIFRMVGLNQYADIFPSLDEATDALH